jgi:hypothetical protein
VINLKLTRGLVVGSMLGMAAAMMMNNQNQGNNTSYSSDMNRQNSGRNASYSSNTNNQYSGSNTSYSSGLSSQNSWSNNTSSKNSDLIIDDKNGKDIIITDILK